MIKTNKNKKKNNKKINKYLFIINVFVITLAYS